MFNHLINNSDYRNFGTSRSSSLLFAVSFRINVQTQLAFLWETKGSAKVDNLIVNFLNVSDTF